MAQAETKPKETTHPPESQEWTPKTALGRKLAAIRAEIIATGEPLLDWNGIACEVAERRGEDDSHLH